MPTAPTSPALRRCALAAAVLHDIDLVPTDDGVLLPGVVPVEVSWHECRRALAAHDVESDEAHARLATWLRMRRLVADHPLEDLAERLRPYGVPVESPSHPGLDWVRTRVLGDALDLGPAFVGLDPSQPDAVEPASQYLLDRAGVDVSPWWPAAVRYLEAMGRIAADRLRRQPTAALHPMGDCDVVTLLGSATFRAALVEEIPDGMRAMAVPMRSRGWVTLHRVDPAFARAAAALTDEHDRGFDRPILVTRDEVATAKDGGRPAEIVLRDPAPPSTVFRDILYRL
jgi:hypothetical protein